MKLSADPLNPNASLNGGASLEALVLKERNPFWD